jgi:hypothetical protein
MPSCSLAFGILRYHDSSGGVIFHAFVLLCAGYLAFWAVRRSSWR